MPQTSAIPQPVVNWDLTLENIRRGKSILFLGPEIFRRLHQPSVDEALAQFLEVENPNHPHIRSYYQQDGLFLLKAKYYKSSLLYDIRRFYAQDFPETIAAFRKLARIPFNVIESHAR